MDRRVDVRHFVHRRSCDISSSNMVAYERWPKVNGRGTNYSSEVCRMRIEVTRPCFSRPAQKLRHWVAPSDDDAGKSQAPPTKTSVVV